MKLLFVGGTSFVGRHAVEAAVEAGHEVTVFHRGHTNDDLLAGSITHRHGDRNRPDYTALDDGTRWDAVIDVSAYVPRHVHQLADAVAGRAGHYVHISSISAYDDAAITTDEDSPLHRRPRRPDRRGGHRRDLRAAQGDVRTGRACSASATIARRSSGRRTSLGRTIRPTASRTGRGGWPAVAMSPSSDQARRCRSSMAVTSGAFIVRCAVSGASGAFDAVGPWAPVEEFLATITPSGVEARFVDVGGAALDAAGTGLPLLSADPEPTAFMTRPGDRARAAGLTTRPLAETGDATRAWDVERGEPALKVGPTPDVEAALLSGR